MDRELEEQIDEIVSKSIKDLKTKIYRIVIKHQTKVNKDKARELKSESITARSRSNKEVIQKVTSSNTGNKKKNDKYYSDSDSCYSE
jgi:hypothetical protein